MAKLEYKHPARNQSPEYSETIEVRVWGMCGTENQPFYIGSGANARSSWTMMIEILYRVAGIQIFYTRNFIDHIWQPQQNQPPDTEPEPVEEHPSVTWVREMVGPEAWEKMNGPHLTPAEQLEELVKTQQGTFGFTGTLPETKIKLEAQRRNFEGESETHTWFDLIISADPGAVFGRTSPGNRLIEINIPMIEPDSGVQFMRDLLAEMDEATKGTHPNPANYPIGSSRWLEIELLNQQAYDRLAEKFSENYFDNPLVAELFDGWLEEVRPFGRVLDVGCGRGEPVIQHLLKRGLQVTGSDLSPEMLRLAAEQ